MKIKNWKKFQHYKDRRPPWIKLHVSILNDIDIHLLDDHTFRTLVLCWVIASEDNGNITDDYKKLAWRLRLKESALLKSVEKLLDGGFLDLGKNRPLAEGWGSRYIKADIKEAVMERDGGRCVWCESTTNLEFDHVIPVSKGGDGEAENIQILCRRCNRRKRNNQSVVAVATQTNDVRTSETEAETDQRQRQSKRQIQNALARANNSNKDFDSFWKIYPRRIGKQAAKKALVRASRTDDWPGIVAVLEALERLKTSHQWQQNNGQYIPHPTTWINRGGWADELPSEGDGYQELIEELEAEARLNE